MMLGWALALLCSGAFCLDQSAQPAKPLAPIQEGFGQYTGDFEIDAGPILKGEAFKTLITKLGIALLHKLTDEDRLELRAKFMAPYLFGGTRFWVWTKSHWQDHVLIFDDVFVESRSGCTATSFFFPPTPPPPPYMFMKIDAHTKDVNIDQGGSKRPKLTCSVQIDLMLKENPAEEAPSRGYAIVCSGRFTLPPHGKKVVWGRSFWNYFVDRCWPY